jgi:hypothetical protein
MRLPAIACVATILSLIAATDVSAAPVELVCKYMNEENHLYIDVDAGTAVWEDQTFTAQVTETQVQWSGITPISSHGRGPDIHATLDRDTGTLLITSEAGSDPDTGVRWGNASTTWACTKAQKIL